MDRPRSPSHAQLRSFNAVVREGGFRKAAEALGVSQPAVTSQIRTLEAAFGVRLFERGHEGTRVTRLGEELYAETAELDAIGDVAQDILMASAELRTGTITVAAGAPNPAMSVIAAFCLDYPGVQLTTYFGNWEGVVEQVSNRHADLGILTAAPESDRFLRAPIFWQRVIALVPSGHELAGRRSLSLHALRRERLIFRTRQSKTQTLIDARLTALALRLRPAMVLEGREAVYEAVAQGLGIGFMLEKATSRIDGVVRMKIDELPDQVPEHVFTLRGQEKRRTVSRFLAVAGALDGSASV